jgi:hypothetical protein
MGIPAIGRIAIPECGEPASQVIASLWLVWLMLREVDGPAWSNLSILQLAVLIAGRVESWQISTLPWLLLRLLLSTLALIVKSWLSNTV